MAGAQGLHVSGSKPPSRVPTAAPKAAKAGAPPGTAHAAPPSTAPPRTAGSVVDALGDLLIDKMMDKFAMVAGEEGFNETVADEVNRYVSRGGGIKEEDLAALEDRIRNRLAGGTPLRNTLATQKRAAMDADEWARIFQFQIEEGKEIQKEAFARRAAARQELVGTLAGQLREQEDRRKAEAEYDRAYHRLEMADQKAFEEEAEAKKRKQWEAGQKLKSDREAQLADRDARKRGAMERKMRDESETAARIAYEAKAEFMKEENARAGMRAAMREFLSHNENNRKAKEAEKAAVAALDAKYAAEYAAILDKQEAKRTEQLEKLKKIQAKQAEDAAGRPEAKTWLDPAIIERYAREKDAEAAAEEIRRAEHHKSVNLKAKLAFDGQVLEKQAAKEEARRVERERAAALLARIKAAEAEEVAKRAALLAKKKKFRETLDAQMKDNAARKIIALMSEDERRINAGLLDRVQTLAATGHAQPAGDSLIPLSPNVKNKHPLLGV